MTDTIPAMKFAVDETPWARWIQNQVIQLARDAERRATGEGSNTRGVNATLGSLATTIDELDEKVQDTFNNLTVNASQVVGPSTLDPAVIGVIPQAQVSGTWTKPVDTTGTGKFDTAVTSAGTGTFTTGVTSPGAYTTDVTLLPGGRTAAWLHNTGVLGQTISTLTKKTSLKDVPYTAAQFREVKPYIYEYKGQVDIRTNPENEFYDPKYKVPTEIGMMAEHLIDAGLELFVERDQEGAPSGIRYAEFAAVATLVLDADVDARLKAAGF